MSFFNLFSNKKKIDEENQKDNHIQEMLEVIGLQKCYDLSEKEFNLIYDLYNDLILESEYCTMIANNNDVDANKSMIENYRLQKLIYASIATKVLLYLKKYLIKRNLKEDEIV